MIHGMHLFKMQYIGEWTGCALASIQGYMRCCQSTMEKYQLKTQSGISYRVWTAEIFKLLYTTWLISGCTLHMDMSTTMETEKELEWMPTTGPTLA